MISVNTNELGIIINKNMDKDVFIQKIIQYEEMFFRISKALVNSDHVSCVVIKKAICEAYQKTNEVTDEDDFIVWFIKILINECRMQLNVKSKMQTKITVTEKENLNYFLSSESLENKVVAELYFIEKLSVDMIGKITSLDVSDVCEKIEMLKGFFCL